MNTKVRMAWGVAAAVLVMIGGQIVRQGANRADAKLRARLLDQVTALARTVNPTLVNTLSFSESDIEAPAFHRLRDHLSTYAHSIPCRGIYTLARRDGVLVFGPESYAPDDSMASPPGTVYRKPAPEFFDLFDSGVPFVIGPVRDEYGEFIIAAAPVFDAQNARIIAVVGMDMDAADWHAHIKRERRAAARSLLPSLAILLAGFGLLAWRRRRRALRRRARLRSAEAWVAAVLGIALTALAARHMRSEDDQARREAFGYLSRLKTARVGAHTRYVRDHLLAQVVRFFEGSDYIDPDEFEIFSLPLTRTPGIDAIGWVQPVEAERAEAWAREMRAEGPSDLTLRPAPDGTHTRRYLIRYLEPADTCSKGTGFDLGSIPAVREALEQASHTGLPTAVSSDVLPPGILSETSAVLIYPWRSPEGEPIGFAIGAIRLEPFLKDILSVAQYEHPAVVICLHAIEPSLSPRFLASSHPEEHALHATPSGEDQSFHPGYDGFSVLHPLFLFGRTYILAAQPGPAFHAAFPGWAERFAWLIGGLLTVLATAGTLGVTRRRDVLEARVEERTAEILATIRSIGDAVIATDREGRVRQMNPVAEQLTGWPESEALGRPLEEVFSIISEITREKSDDPVRRVLRSGRTVQLANHTLLVARDGTERPIADSAAPIQDADDTVLGVVLVFRDQTEEREAHRKLEESEAFTRTVLDHLPLGIAVNSIKPPVIFQFMNENFPAIYRTTREKLMDPDAFWAAVYPDPEFREQIRARVLEDSASGDPKRMQWDDIPVVREGGEPYYISARNIPVPDRDLVISTVWDVSKSVRHAQERRGTIGLLQILVRPTSLPDLLRDVAGWWQQWVGCEAVHLHLTNGETYAHTGEVKEPGAVITEIPVQAGDDELGHIRFLNSSPFHFSARDTARFARWAHSLALAIKQRQDAEALRRSRRLAHIAGQAAHLGGWSLDLSTDRVEWSDVVAAIHEKPPGYTPAMEEALSFYLPEDRDRIRTVLAACIREGKPYDEVAQIQTPSGRRVWVRTVGEAERDSSGKIVRVQGAFQDISARVELEQQLRQAQKLESVGRLAGGVAHDFNNMLQTILGNAELLLDLFDLDDPPREMVKEISQAAQRSADLTRQLLAFSRKQTIQPRILDLNETIADVLKMLRRMLGEDIDLLWTPGTNLWPVRMDPAQVTQILTNLAVNARDAIEGVGKLTIETDSARLDEDYGRRHGEFLPGAYVVLSVSDDGCGMDAQTQEKIFEPFFTTKPKGKGTGLGLSTVFGIVRQNDGFVHVYSEVGKGTTFQIYLPRGEDAIPEADPVEPSDDVAGRQETILLVEDEKGILELARRMLEPLGYRVWTAATPAEALRVAAAREGTIDLLLTDVVMPDMSGRDLWNELVALRPGLRCLFMSGYTENVIAHRGILEPGMHFLQKPFSTSGLAQAVRSALA